MRLLALDAAAGRCSAALAIDAEVQERSVESGKAHTEDLLALTASLLRDAGIVLSELDAIVSSVGPGSFTGVRVTVSVVQGLAFGADLPVVAVNTLEALALQALSNHAAALACLDARMGEVYWGCYARDARVGARSLTAPAVGAPEAVRLPRPVPFAGIGQGLAAYPGLVASLPLTLEPAADRALPRAREFALLGALRFAQGGGIDPALLEPLYLRDKVAYTTAERSGR